MRTGRIQATRLKEGVDVATVEWVDDSLSEVPVKDLIVVQRESRKPGPPRGTYFTPEPDAVEKGLLELVDGMRARNREEERDDDEPQKPHEAEELAMAAADAQAAEMDAARRGVHERCPHGLLASCPSCHQETLRERQIRRGAQALNSGIAPPLLQTVRLARKLTEAATDVEGAHWIECGEELSASAALVMAMRLPHLRQAHWRVGACSSREWQVANIDRSTTTKGRL